MQRDKSESILLVTLYLEYFEELLHMDPACIEIIFIHFYCHELD